MQHRTVLSALLLACLACAARADAATTPDYADRLIGDWQGERLAMHEQGVDWDLTYRLDLLGQIDHPSHMQDVYWLGQLDLQLSVDAEKRFGWAGTTLFLHIIGNHGDTPAIESNRLPHGLDNIEVPEGAQGFKVFHAWLDKHFEDIGLSAKIGLYGLDSEFYVTEHSGLFIHPTYGVGAEFAGTGQNGPSIFPYSSFGLRLRYQPDPAWYAQVAILDGVPGDPDHPKSNRIAFEDGDGLLYVGEAGYHPALGEERDAKIAIGLWRYSERFDDLDNTDSSGHPEQRISQGAYALAKGTLWRDAAQGEQLAGFVRGGLNDGDTTQFSAAWSIGVVWQGLIASRPDDPLGLGYSQEHNSRKWRNAKYNTVHFERALEFTYRGSVTPWLALQPFIQYLINHGSDPDQNHTC